MRFQKTIWATLFWIIGVCFGSDWVTAGVVINEIMYRPASLLQEDEYIELYNSGPEAADLSHWAFVDGIRYTFLPGTLLPSEGFLILAASPPVFQKRFPTVQAVGPFEGKLSNDGETIRLVDAQNRTVDKVPFLDERGWPPEADGLGPSIERIHPDMSSIQPESWRRGPNGGSPGKLNTSRVINPLPIVRGIQQSPVSPKSKDTVHFTCLVDHPIPVQEVNIFYRRETDTFFSSSEMFDDGSHGDGAANDRIYGGDIPPMPDGSVIEFYIDATDSDLVHGFFPLQGAARTAIYRVDNKDYSTSLPFYRIVMRDKDERILRTRDPRSNDELDASFIFNDDIFYNVGVRFRGKGSRGKEPKSYRVNFSLTRYFRSIRKLNLNAQEPHRQFVGLESFKAIDMPSPQHKFVSVLFNTRFVPNYIQVERTGKEMMDRIFGDESGNLYRGVEQANLDYRGENVNAYRPHYVKVTNELQDDFSDIIALCAAFSLTSDDEFVDILGNQININHWIRWFAMKKILNDLEGGLSKERGDDYYMYHNPVDDLFYVLPWDLDSVLVRPFRSLFQYDTPAIRRFLTHPEIAPRYFAELDKILNRDLPQDRMDSIIDQTTPVTSNGQREDMKVVSRDMREFILSSIPRSLTVTVNREAGLNLVNENAVSRFFRGKSNPPADWNNLSFDDSSWEQGPGGFGYGDGDDRTVLADMRNNYTTVFVRQSFQVQDPQMVNRLFLNVLYDDAFVAYLNGIEVARNNFSGEPSFQSTASRNHEAGAPELFSLADASNILVPGKNVLALVGINVSRTSSDLSLAFRLDASTKSSDKVELIGNTHAIKTRRVRINGQIASFTPWRAQWSYATTLQHGRNVYDIEALDASGEVFDATRLVVYKDIAPPKDGREIIGEERWLAEQSPIRIDQNIIVNQLDSLYIGPGVTIRMASAAAVIVYGTLVVEGSEDRPVQFLSDVPTQPWGGIAIDEARGPIHIRYASFTGSKQFSFRGKTFPAAINVLKSTATIEGCYFTRIAPAAGVGSGIDAKESFLTIRGNTFESMGEMIHGANCSAVIENNRFTTIFGHNDAIDFDGQFGPPTIIRNNVIRDSEDDGIDGGFISWVIENNWIEGCRDKGISLEGDSTPLMVNNVIVNCNIGIAVKDRSQARVVHNTIVSSTRGIRVYEKIPNAGGAEATIINTIIWDSQTSLEIDEKSKADVNHSNLMQLPPSFTDTNSSLEPLFVDALKRDFHLHDNSPLIDAGEPTDVRVDFDGNERPFGQAPDIGAFESNRITNVLSWELF